VTEETFTERSNRIHYEWIEYAYSVSRKFGDWAANSSRTFECEADVDYKEMVIRRFKNNC
jgi:hypothetical protein